MALTKISSSVIATNAISGTLIADNAITAVHIAQNAITQTQIAAGALSDALAANSITAAMIPNTLIDSEHYALGSIDNAHLADDAVNSDELAAGAIDLAHMSVNSIDSDQYVDGSIDTAHLAADVITGANIADDAIDSEHYNDGSIDAAHLAAAQTNITSVGTLTTLTVDNVIVNGTTIGHTGDTDLMTLTSGKLTVAGDVYIGGSNKELRFYEGSNYVGFEAPALSANQIWVLPTVDGSANQTLKTDGSGTLSWATAASAVSNLTDVTLSSASNKDILVYNGSAWINTPTASNPSVDTMTGDGSDVTLALTKTPLHENATSVYIDGVYQSKGNYSVSGTTLTFSTAPPSGTAVECMTGNNGTVATLFNVVNKAGSNIACAILNAAITVVGKTGNITVGVT